MSEINEQLQLKLRREQSEPAKDEYIVWGPGELPKQFRDMQGPLEELEGLDVTDGSWLRGRRGSGFVTLHNRMKRSDYERLTSSDAILAAKGGE